MVGKSLYVKCANGWQMLNVNLSRNIVFTELFSFIAEQ